METITKPEEGFTPPATAGRDHNILSLNELIAEIDSETAVPFGRGAKEEEIAPKLDGMHTSLKDQYILLALEKTFFALPLTCALEIGRRPEITPLPNLPNWVLGISNIRGEIISFINLKAFFGISATGAKVGRRFLIIHNPGMKVGIIVDRILGILALNQIDADLQNSPYREGEIANYIFGVAVSGENLTNILDIDKLLSSPRMTVFKEN
jgi:purine-binding chemotaxis protein CheW